MIQKWNDKLNMMKDIVPHGTVGAEFGVFGGYWAQEWLRVTRPARLYLVDPWAYQDPNVYKSWANSEQSIQDGRYESVLQLFAKEIASGIVLVHRCFAVDAVMLFEDNKFDWLSYDANHSKESVLAFLHTYLPKLKVGGLFLIDDYHSRGDEQSYGVVHAVQQFLEKNDSVTPVGITGGRCPVAVLQRLL